MRKEKKVKKNEFYQRGHHVTVPLHTKPMQSKHLNRANSQKSIDSHYISSKEVAVK